MKQKSVLTALIMAITLVLAISCDKEENPQDGKGEITFSFEKADMQSSAALKSATAIEDAATVIVSIEDNVGNLVYELEEVKLKYINGSFISKPLSLLVGDYSLVQFIVVDKDGTALYMSPIEGSPKAYLVNDPLPIEFSIAKDEVTKLIPEVLDVEESQPEDFGYATFSFEVVETFDFLIGVFVYNETIENYELTTANLIVEGDGSEIYNDSVEAVTDTITVNDGYLEYILTVEKEGYAAYIDTFTNTELKLYFSSEDNGPLVVVLEEITGGVISFTTDQSTLKQVLIQFKIGGIEEIPLTINWGDNTSDNMIVIPSTITSITHIYLQTGIYEILISGDLSSLTYFSSCYNQLIFINIEDALNIEYLYIHNNSILEVDISKNLKLKGLNVDENPLNSLNISNNVDLETISYWSTGISDLDISNNLKLESIFCGNNNILTMDISQHLQLKQLDCSFNIISSIDFSNNQLIDNILIDNNNLNSENVNQIFSDILAGVIANPRTGRIYIYDNAPPTGQGIIDMNELIDNYGWEIIAD